MRKLADEVRFKGYRCGAYETRYPEHAGGTRAIVLAYGDPEASTENEMVAVATRNVGGVSERLADDLVVVATYSENEGMLEALVEAGVVEDGGEGRVRLRGGPARREGRGLGEGRIWRTRTWS